MGLGVLKPVSSLMDRTQEPGMMKAALISLHMSDPHGQGE